MNFVVMHLKGQSILLRGRNRFAFVAKYRFPMDAFS